VNTRILQKVKAELGILACLNLTVGMRLYDFYEMVDNLRVVFENKNFGHA
jgi:hypothetical protein